MSLGLNLYSGVTPAGIHLSSTGFKIYQIANTAIGATVQHDAPDYEIFIMVKNISKSNNADIQLRFDNTRSGVVTDDFAKNATYSTSTLNTLTLEVQDLLYGRFNKLLINRPASGTSIIMVITAPK